MAEDTKKQNVRVEEQETIEYSELDNLLQKTFKPKTDESGTAINYAVKTLAQIALEETQLVSDNVVTTIEALIASIDRKLSDQVNEVIHHEKFRDLEGRWRGFHHLVSNTETDETLKIKFLNASKKEIGKVLKKYKGTEWDQSPLFKKFYEEEYGTAGGEPFGCIIADYTFTHRAPDIAWLQGIQQIAAASHAPLISAAAPELFNMDSWQELGNPRDLSKIFQSPEYASWRSLRESEDSKYLALTLPRTLARLPYNEKDNPVEEFSFDETTDGSPDDIFAWSNAAYAMGVNINRSFKLYGWCSCIRGVENGGTVENLPVYTFNTDDGGVDMRCPTEIAITDRREAELSNLGTLPLVHWKNTDYAVFIGAQSLYSPAVYEDPDATANASLSARLPYMFAMCRFAHYLKCIVRDKLGSFATKYDMQKYLENWIARYVVNGDGASDLLKSKYPLSAAEVVVEEDASNPGYYKSFFYLKPHYQLEGLTVSLRLVSKLPSEK
ncbi:MAG: type VI secretion system contractile sheath large subunit [bacterium]|nr:type VI secretion system contractile sheath large subunit [bacterium]